MAGAIYGPTRPHSDNFVRRVPKPGPVGRARAEAADGVI